MPGSVIRTTAFAAGSITALTAAIALWVPLSMWQADKDYDRQKTPASQQAKANIDFQALVQRPLFRKSRLAENIPNSNEPTKAKKGPLIVKGVAVRDKRHKLALIENPATGKTHRLIAGDNLGEWMVDEINLFEVVLTKSSGEVLTLKVPR